MYILINSLVSKLFTYLQPTHMYIKCKCTLKAYSFEGICFFLIPSVLVMA